MSRTDPNARYLQSLGEAVGDVLSPARVRELRHSVGKDDAEDLTRDCGVSVGPSAETIAGWQADDRAEKDARQVATLVTRVEAFPDSDDAPHFEYVDVPTLKKLVKEYRRLQANERALNGEME